MRIAYSYRLSIRLDLGDGLKAQDVNNWLASVMFDISPLLRQGARSGIITATGGDKVGEWQVERELPCSNSFGLGSTGAGSSDDAQPDAEAGQAEAAAIADGHRKAKTDAHDADTAHRVLTASLDARRDPLTLLKTAGQHQPDAGTAGVPLDAVAAVGKDRGDRGAG